MIFIYFQYLIKWDQWGCFNLSQEFKQEQGWKLKLFIILGDWERLFTQKLEAVTSKLAHKQTHTVLNLQKEHHRAKNCLIKRITLKLKHVEKWHNYFFKCSDLNLAIKVNVYNVLTILIRNFKMWCIVVYYDFKIDIPKA